MNLSVLNIIALRGSYAGIAERDLVAHCIYSKAWFSYAAKVPASEPPALPGTSAPYCCSRATRKLDSS